MPQDISVAGSDDIPASAQAIPPLTTLRQPISEMAAAAFHAIADRQQKTVSIPGKLMIRSSCASSLIARSKRDIPQPTRGSRARISSSDSPMRSCKPD
ncbi:MAG: substrate-binding domain-containing protein, partial [Verrucomicrobiota bacterium]